MSEMIFIPDCRVSFPAFFKKPVINGEEGKYGATLMLEPDKHAKVLTEIKAEMARLVKDDLKGQRLAPEKYCLRNGADKRDEYEGYLVLSASNDNKPIVINGQGNGVIDNEDDCKIYSGCYANAKIKLWAQNNQFGKRINARLVAIQFERDGETLDGRHVPLDAAMSGFSASSAAANDDEFFSIDDSQVA